MFVDLSVSRVLGNIVVVVRVRRIDKREWSYVFLRL